MLHAYEIRRKDHRGVDLISDALPFGRLWYGEPNAVRNAVGYAKPYSRSHDAVIRVYDDVGDVSETHVARWRFQRAVIFPRKAQKKPRTCKRSGAFQLSEEVPKRRLFLAHFLEARILSEWIEHRIEPEQRGSERQDCIQ